MEEVIYGDIYFIINFSMDFLVLYICGKIRQQKLKVIPMIFSAAVGSIYALTALFISNGNLIEWLILLCVAALMCYIAFDLKSIGSLTVTLSLFIAVNFLLSGGITALYSMLNRVKSRSVLDPKDMLPNISEKIPPILLLLLALGSGLFSFIWSLCMKKNITQAEASVHIEQNGHTIDCRGLCDSGNLLCEPISGRPVLVIKRELFSALAGERLIKMIAVGKLDKLSDKEQRQIRYIPMQSVGGDGILIGLVPDKVTVNGEERDVCIAPNQNSSCDLAGYDLLISPSLLS